MRDREFLFWIHERLLNIHGEPKDIDYMSKLRSIIIAYDPEKITPNIASDSDLTEWNIR